MKLQGPELRHRVITTGKSSKDFVAHFSRFLVFVFCSAKQYGKWETICRTVHQLVATRSLNSKEPHSRGMSGALRPPLYFVDNSTTL